MREQLVPYAVEIALTVLTIVAGWVAVKMRELAKERIESERAQRVALRVGEAVSRAVRASHQTIAYEMREAARDGKITSEEARVIAQATLRDVKAYLGKNGLAELKAIIGTASDNALDDVLATAIEAEVYETRK